MLAALVTTLSACDAPIEVSPHAAELHRNALVFDAHTDTLLLSYFRGYDLGQAHWPPLGFMPWMGHVDLPRAREGGLDAMWLGIVVNPVWGDGGEQVRRWIARAQNNLLKPYRDQVELAWSADDISAISAQGRIPVQFLIEGAHGLGTDTTQALGNLDEFYGLGVRAIGLAHFTNNEYAASSAASHPHTPGLTAAGKAVVRRMNALGMAIDLAHVHPESFRDTVALSTAPVIVSHTGIAALKPTFRNLQDWQIKAVAQTGGVIGVMFACQWLNEEIYPPLDAVVDSMEYLKKMVGAQHVAIGSDFDGFIWTPRGMRDVRDLPKLTELMVRRGFTDDEIRGILGGNLLRVLREIESQRTVVLPRR